MLLLKTFFATLSQGEKANENTNNHFAPLRQGRRAKRRGWIKRKTNLINEKPLPNPVLSVVH